MSRKKARPSNYSFTDEFMDQLVTPQTLSRMNRAERRRVQGDRSIAGEAIARIDCERFKLEPKTQGQAELLYGMENFNQVIVSGPAGTGKTFMVAAYAAQLLLQKKIEKIVITRPNVPTGRTLGLFPGDINQKMAVWLQPVIAVLKKVLGTAIYEIEFSRGNIIFQPLETIRGASFDNAFIIIDESQNIEVEEVKAIVTRVGNNTTLVFNGDINQKDIKSESGLQFLLDKISSNRRLAEVSFIVELDVSDVVRSKLCKLWVEALNVH